MARTHKEAALLKAATELLKANNTVTTLELKTKLRKDEAEYYWSQDIVSKMMEELAIEGMLTYTDNGTFRTYSATPKRGRGRPKNLIIATKPVPVSVQAPVIPVKRGRGRPRKNLTVNLGPKASTALASGAPVSIASAPITLPTAKAKYISHTKALELMENNKGHFFTAVFVKKNQTERVMNCKLMANQLPDRLGYIKVKEASLLRQGKESIRNVNLQTLKALRIGKVDYRIR